MAFKEPMDPTFEKEDSSVTSFNSEETEKEETIVITVSKFNELMSKVQRIKELTAELNDVKSQLEQKSHNNIDRLRIYDKEHPEKVAERARRYREKNKEENNAKRRERYRQQKQSEK